MNSSTSGGVSSKGLGPKAVAEALAFHQLLGPARKAAHLRALREAWVGRLLEHDRLRLNTSRDARFAVGIASFRVEGMEPKAQREGPRMIGGLSGLGAGGCGVHSSLSDSGARTQAHGCDDPLSL